MGGAYSYLMHPYAQEVDYGRFVPGTEKDGFSAELM